MNGLEATQEWLVKHPLSLLPNKYLAESPHGDGTWELVCRCPTEEIARAVVLALRARGYVGRIREMEVGE